MKFENKINVFINNRIEQLEYLKIENNKIVEIKTAPTTNFELDILIPGLIDLQIYGTAEILFSADPTIENLQKIEHELLKKGTTSFLICVATNTPLIFNKCIEVVKEHRKISKNCLGIHLEGPFLNISKSGAHVKEYIRKATVKEIKELIEFGDGVIKMITIAPETQDEEVIKYLLDQNIIVSIGHSDANFNEATKAFNYGAQTTTHLFNAMNTLHHRDLGIPAAVINHPTALASIIVDGAHVDYQMVKIAHKLLKERLFLITDAVAECNKGPYQHKLVDDKFMLPDGTLSGSNLTMIQAVKNCIEFCDINKYEAINMATKYPAKLLKSKYNLGDINLNQQANFLLLDNEMNLKQIYFQGKRI